MAESIFNTSVSYLAYIPDFFTKDQKSLLLPLLTAGVIGSALFLITTEKKSKNTITVDGIDPPEVPYSIPFIGHSLQLQRDGVKFAKEMAAKYGDSYTIYLLGKKYTIVSQEMGAETFKAGEDHLSFRIALQESLPIREVDRISYEHKYLPDPEFYEESPLPPAARKFLKTGQLEVYSSLMDKGIKESFEVEFGRAGSAETITIENVQSTLRRIVARISCLCFAGEEIGNNEELVTAMAILTNKIVIAGLIIATLPEWLGNFLVRRYFSLEKEIDLTIQLAKPVLDEYLRQKQLKEAAGEPWTGPTNFLQQILELPRKDGLRHETMLIAFTLHSVAFASVHTSTLFASFAVHDLAGRPEIQEPLRAEILAHLDPVTGLLDAEAFKKMPMMDSFLREVLRTSVDTFGMHHKVLHDYTFARGFRVPAGRTLAVDLWNIQISATVPGGEPEKFKAFRFVDTPTKKAVNVAPDYLIFGIGEHACPGRYFATREIKNIIAGLLLRYDLRTGSGGRTNNRLLFGMRAMPPLDAIILTPRM